MVQQIPRGQNFCSEVSRKTIKFRGVVREAIFKKARNSTEQTLLRNEIDFYSKFLPIYNVLNQLHFSGVKICPSFFKHSGGLFIQDLKKYHTEENISFSKALLIIDRLACFHAIGFYLKKFTQWQKSSQRIRGSKNWCTFVHGDCWARNFMFCGKNSIKLIDFGFFGYDHCLKDLVYLLFTSTQSLQAIRLCKYYRDRLQRYLRVLNIEFDTSDFWRQARKIAKRVHPLALHVITTVKSGTNRRRQQVHSIFILNQLSWHPQRGWVIATRV